MSSTNNKMKRDNEKKKENEEQLKLVKTRRVQRRKSRTLALVAKHLKSL